ncbi:uncharacterized protein PGTG_21785 [Puccinia graminis f. sp. tritici CRL 75-36-700-3]|uniref:Uncharacterized protein n=1 Tax=Puccinia graminis f. sp. tritici (strain CRL 75-36-700-3 / race SCCL) TaxID=418459 RepID=H6QSG9_PUCGT|nr:uncharacterized protein PGTG_21785 [Puccinia graminis f. sp. tritici CRL 75-36-700-3]EHS63706.1 hypothetical protein PGTG_21785 [Puccinia graminis f. sp. tritici CRL 75-36-700-3]
MTTSSKKKKKKKKYSNISKKTPRRRRRRMQWFIDHQTINYSFSARLQVILKKYNPLQNHF